MGPIVSTISSVISSIILIRAALFGVSITCRMSVLPLFHQKWVIGCQNRVNKCPTYYQPSTINPFWTTSIVNQNVPFVLGQNFKLQFREQLRPIRNYVKSSNYRLHLVTIFNSFTFVSKFRQCFGSSQKLSIPLVPNLCTTRIFPLNILKVILIKALRLPRNRFEMTTQTGRKIFNEKFRITVIYFDRNFESKFSNSNELKKITANDRSPRKND